LKKLLNLDEIDFFFLPSAKKPTGGSVNPEIELPSPNQITALRTWYFFRGKPVYQESCVLKS
jgi:hypothetical protein